MTTIDHNPQIMAELTRGSGEPAGALGRAVGEALEQAGQNTGRTEEVGEGIGIGSAVQPPRR